MSVSLKRLSGILLFSTLVASCNTLPEFRACTELAIDKGYCVNAISGFEQDIDDEHFLKNDDGTAILDGKGFGYSWWKMRPYMVQIPYFDYVRIKSFIIKECKANPGRCDDKVSSWDATLENLDKVIKQK